MKIFFRNFYEFFFSHLPLIEYQIKELKEKVVKNLEFYFNPGNSNQISSVPPHRSSFSGASQNSQSNLSMPSSLHGSLGNRSHGLNFYHRMFSVNIYELKLEQLKSKFLNFLMTFYDAAKKCYFTQFAVLNFDFKSIFFEFLKLKFSILNAFKLMANLCFKDFEEYDNKFNLLYQSPRLCQPAWLTLINNRKLISTLTPSQANGNSSVMTNITNSSSHNKPKSINIKPINSKTSNENNFINNQKVQSSNSLNICGSILNELIYLNKALSSRTQNGINSRFEQQSKRFLSTFRQSIRSRTQSQTSLTEEPNQFLSVILSTVLKHHLSWVYTVLPSNEIKIKKDGHKSTLRKQRANWTSILEKTNPYNPLWAQLGDLHGAVSQPLKLVRTVVVGKNKELAERILFLLSYFIRCGNSSYFDISSDGLDIEKMIGGSSSPSLSSSVSSGPSLSPNAYGVCFNGKGNSKKKAGMNYNDEESNNLELTKVVDNCPREVNVFELNIDPLSSFTAAIANAKAINSDKKTRLNHNDEFSMSSQSSSSSMTSPSSCSVSSSPVHSNPNKGPKKGYNNYQAQTVMNNARKQRLLSSNSNGENCNAQELPLIGCLLKPNHLKSTQMQDNFGYSLLASYCDEFVFDFVIHATSDRTFFSNLHDRLKFSKQNSILDSPIEESIYVVIDCDEL